MTILPKKKHQDLRKNEQEQDDTRNRRHRSSQRNRNQPISHDDLDNTNDESTSSLTLSSSTSYDELDGGREPPEVSRPQKRCRHRHSNAFYMSPQNPTASSVISPPVSIARSVSREERHSPAESGDEDGYNSSDEHGPRSNKTTSLDMLNEREVEFERELSEKKGFLIKQMATDGACMFRAVADQVYGDQEMHSIVRQHCMDYMVKNRDFFSQYITEDFSSYIRRKRNPHAHGNHTEMQALSEMYNRPIEVYQYSYEPINSFHSRTYSYDDNAPIRLSYHGNVHYNSVIDPYNPTVGVGLGLAGYKPGLDNQDLRKTLEESETTLLEKEMLEDKLKATDWEATNEQLAELAARESYMQWLKDSQKLASSGASSSAGSSTQSKNETTNDINFRKSPSRELSTVRRSPRNEQNDRLKKSPPRETKRSPSHDKTDSKNIAPLNKQSKANGPYSIDDSLHSTEIGSTDPYHNNYNKDTSEGACSSSTSWSYALGYAEDWDNDPVLAAVLAESQQEYLDSLSKHKSKKLDNS